VPRVRGGVSRCLRTRNLLRNLLALAWIATVGVEGLRHPFRRLRPNFVRTRSDGGSPLLTSWRASRPSASRQMSCGRRGSATLCGCP
jgi:hypothetical protein